jgi:hypothetical protein
MANHVTTHVEFHRISEAGKAKFDELIARLRVKPNNSWSDGRPWLGDMWVDGKEGSPTYEDTDQYAWTTENIGPKWCYIDDMDDGYINLVSAWSVPEEGLRWLFDQIIEVDPTFIATIQYEDEMPNFYGAYVYDKDGTVDMFEDDWDDLKELVAIEHPELLELEEESDEWWDCMNDNMYEALNEKQWEFIQEILENLSDEE